MHGSVTEPNGRHTVNATLRPHLCTRGCNTLCSLPRAPCTPSPRARRRCRVGSSAGSHSSRSRSTGSRSSTPATVRRLQGRSRDGMSRFPGEEAVYNADAGLYWTLQITALVTHYSSLATLCTASLSVLFFQQHLLPVSHFSNSDNNSDILWLLYLLWWSMISDLWCECCHCLGAPGTYQTGNSIDKCFVCVLTAPPGSWTLISLPFFEPPYSLRPNNNEIRSTCNPAKASKHSNERKSHTFLTWNQNPGINKLSEEGVLKDETGQKSDLMTVSQVVDLKKTLEGN